MGVANLFMRTSYLQQTQVSYPYTISCSTFLTPRSQPLAHWRIMILPFDGVLWAVTLSTMLAGGLLLQWLSLLYRWLMDGSCGNTHRFGEAMFYIIQAVTGVHGSERSDWPIRGYTSFWWVFCFLITLIYRTALITRLTAPILPSPTNTIEELARSGVYLYGHTALFSDLSNRSSDSNAVKMGQRFRTVPANTSVEELLSGGDAAFMENKANIQSILAEMVKRDPVFEQRLHVMEECLTVFPVAIAMAPGSQFRQQVHHIINRLNAAGLVEFWMRADARHHLVHQRRSTGDSKVPFSLDHLQGCFYLLIVGCLITFSAFLAEIAHFKIRNLQRHGRQLP